MAIRTNPRLYFVIKKILDAKKKGGGALSVRFLLDFQVGRIGKWIYSTGARERTAGDTHLGMMSARVLFDAMM